jgi:excisionase family DNA binding protein
MTDPLEDRALTIREAAQMLAVSQRTLFNLTSRGEIPCLRIGGSKRYRLATLREFLARKEAESAALVLDCDSGNGL